MYEKKNLNESYNKPSLTDSKKYIKHSLDKPSLIQKPPSKGPTPKKK